MQSRSIRRSGQPTCAIALFRMRAIDRDLIRGGHYGQRSCEPFRGIFEVSEQCPNMPLSNCPCVSFVAPNVLAVTGLFRPFPSLP